MLQLILITLSALLVQKQIKAVFVANGLKGFNYINFKGFFHYLELQMAGYYWQENAEKIIW